MKTPTNSETICKYIILKNTLKFQITVNVFSVCPRIKRIQYYFLTYLNLKGEFDNNHRNKHTIEYVQNQLNKRNPFMTRNVLTVIWWHFQLHFGSKENTHVVNIKVADIGMSIWKATRKFFVVFTNFLFKTFSKYQLLRRANYLLSWHYVHNRKLIILQFTSHTI